MPKKHKKKVSQLTTELAKKCTILSEPLPEPELKPIAVPDPAAREPPLAPEEISMPTTSATKTILSDNINPSLLAQWPKLKKKVPPVFLHNPVEFESHVKKVLNRGIRFYQPHRGNNYIRIFCESYNDYKHFIKYLNKVEMPYHTYGLPCNRKMKVVIKNLPNTLDVNEIKRELKSVSIPIVRTHRMKTGPGTIPGTMLVLAVVPYDDDGKNILRLQVLLGHKVVLQPPEDKAKQCYRCQKWGHAQRYCHGRIKCVKCAGDHLTNKCEKPYEEEPKCANCSQPHTASFRQCIFTRRPLDYTIMKKAKLLTPCYKNRVIVTEKNYEQLYKNVDYSKGNTTKSTLLPHIIYQASTNQPRFSQPCASQLSTGQPSTSQPCASQLSTGQPSTSQPSLSQQITRQPSTSQPSTTQPSSSQTNIKPSLCQAGTSQSSLNQASTSQASTSQASASQISSSQASTSKSRKSKSKKK